ncbi:hypothetical protein GCM10027184_69200 [Saccharothrix stipae]
MAWCRDLVGRRRNRQGTGHAVPAGLERPAGTLDEVAAELAISLRTLRRRPAAAGTGFQELLDEARAVDLLTTTTATVERVAAELGYAEAAGFIHPFRRWHGTTSSDYGRQHRAA